MYNGNDAIALAVLSIASHFPIVATTGCFNMDDVVSMLLDQILPGLRVMPLSEDFLKAAQKRLDTLTKPRGSLGRLESLACRLYAMSEGRMPLTVEPAMMLTVAGDHGVAAQKVSPYPQVVTRQMVDNLLNGGAAINVLSRVAGMEVRVVDAGCCGGPFPPHPALLVCRLGDGTADLTKGPAMSRAVCLQGLRWGVTLAASLADDGYRCLGTGEMGIANSTTAAALYCALTGQDASCMVGPGAGADATMVRHKIDVVRRALHVNAAALCGDAVDVLAALGGFEIVLMAGLMLGAAARRLPVLVDGFICSAAYVAALRICPALQGYAVLAHASAEPGHHLALEALTGCHELDTPLLHLGMRLGEGTGGAVAYPLLRSAAAVFNDMATFTAAGISDIVC